MFADVLHRTGLSAAELSSRSGLRVEAIVDLLDGSEPSMSQMRAIAHGLRVPLSFFAEKEGSRTDGLRLHFRSTMNSSGGVDLSVEKVAKFVSAALEVLPTRSEAPWLVNLSDQFPPDEAAEACRSALGLQGPAGSMADLPGLIGNLDGVVLTKLKASRFEGVSLFQDNYLFIFVSPRFLPRMLFTLAHELGHAALGHLNANEPIFDLPTSIGNVAKSKKKERDADDFASKLVLPKSGVGAFLSQLRRSLNIPSGEGLGDIEIIFLARFFGVSFEVAALRCEKLGLLPPGGAYSLARHIKEKHGSAEKRAEQVGVPARQNLEFKYFSTNLLNVIRERLDLGYISSGWVSENFDISIPELMCLNR